MQLECYVLFSHTTNTIGTIRMKNKQDIVHFSFYELNQSDVRV